MGRILATLLPLLLVATPALAEGAGLARIEILGPDAVAVASRATYALRGYDAAGNEVALRTSELPLLAPRDPGQAVLSYAEGGVASTRNVRVTDLRYLALESTAERTNVGRGVWLWAIGMDEALAPVDVVGPAWVATNGWVDERGVFTPTTAGLATVAAHAGSHIATRSVYVMNVLLVDVAAARPAYDALEAASRGIEASVRVTYGSDGAPVSGAFVELRVERQGAGGLVSHVVRSRTDAAGELRLTLPLAFSLPGEYQLRAAATFGGNGGSASPRSYTVS